MRLIVPDNIFIFVQAEYFVYVLISIFFFHFFESIQRMFCEDMLSLHKLAIWDTMTHALWNLFTHVHVYLELIKN